MFDEIFHDSDEMGGIIIKNPTQNVDLKELQRKAVNSGSELRVIDGKHWRWNLMHRLAYVKGFKEMEPFSYLMNSYRSGADQGKILSRAFVEGYSVCGANTPLNPLRVLEAIRSNLRAGMISCSEETAIDGWINALGGGQTLDQFFAEEPNCRLEDVEKGVLFYLEAESIIADWITLKFRSIILRRFELKTSRKPIILVRFQDEGEAVKTVLADQADGVFCNLNAEVKIIKTR